MEIQINTLLYLFAAGNLFVVVCFSAFLLLYRVRNGVLLLFVGAKLLESILCLLLGMRLIISPMLSIGVSNPLLLFAISFEIFCIRYVADAMAMRRLWIFLALGTFSSLVFLSFIQQPEPVRTVVISILISVLLGIGGILLLLAPERSKIQGLAMVLCFANSLAFLIRSTWIVHYDPALLFLSANMIQFVSYTLLFLTSNTWSIVLLFILKERDERQIRHDNDQLRKLNTDKDILFSIIAHDLRSPISQLSQIGEQLWLRKDSLNSNLRNRYALALYQSSKRTFALLDNLLQWARANSGRISVTPVAIPLKALVDEVCAIYQPIADEKKILISNTLKEHVRVTADVDMLRTVIRNLISNAIKFSHPAGLIKIISSPDGEMQATGVIDNGVGISKDTLTQISANDTLVSTRGTKDEKGTGLGLKLCKEFMERNQGSLLIESEAGQGTKVWFSLPRVLD